MIKFFETSLFEIIMQRQIASFVGTLASIKAQEEAYKAESRRSELKIAYSQREFDLQNEIFESRNRDKMK